MKRNGSGELAAAHHILSGKFSTAIQQVNYPMHKGLPNPAHGKFFFVGSIPAAYAASLVHWPDDDYVLWP